MTDDNKNNAHLWSSEDQRMLDWSSWTPKDRQDLMEVYTPEQYMKSLELYKSLERDPLIADIYARYKLMTDVRTVQICRFHDQVEERERCRRFPTPWEKDL